MKQQEFNDNIIGEILKENQELFSEKEYKIAVKNIELIRKIYLLGYINARETYKN